MRIVEVGTASRASDWRWTLAGLAVLLAWDAGGLDMALARLAGGDSLFPLRDHWILARLLHQDARQAAWLVGAWLLAGLAWPTGVLRRIPLAGRVQWLATTVFGLLLVAALKYASQTSCPWDMSEFGGIATHVSHWAWTVGDGGPGGCFPAGHASAGFAFLGGYFVLRQAAPRQAMVSLAASMLAGLVLGLAQQLRGAHFLSHTLWTAWICWVAAFALDILAQAGRRSVAGILASHEA